MTARLKVFMNWLPEELENAYNGFMQTNGRKGLGSQSHALIIPDGQNNPHIMHVLYVWYEDLQQPMRFVPANQLTNQPR